MPRTNDSRIATTTTKNAIEIDNILSQRMQQNKIASDIATATKRLPPPAPAGAESQKSSGDEDSVDR